MRGIGRDETVDEERHCGPSPATTPKDTAWWELDDNGHKTGCLCAGCGATFTVGYGFMLKDEFVARLSGDAPFRDAVQKARKVMEGDDTRACKPSEVTEGVEVGYEMTRNIKCYTKNSYRRIFGYFPEELNHKPVELLDEHGDAWNAYMVSQSDDMDIRDLRVTCRKVGRCMTFVQVSQDTLHEQQAAQYFQKVTQEPKSSLLRKLQKAVPRNTILAKAAEMTAAADGDAGSGRAFYASSAVASGGGSAARSALDAAASVGSAAASTTPHSPIAADHAAACTPPTVFKHSRASSDLFGAQSEAGDCKSVWAGESTLGGSSGKCGPARTVEGHMYKLPLVQILAGVRPGRELRWAEKFAEEKVNNPDIGLLQAHIKAVYASIALQKHGALKVSEADLTKHLHTLVKAGVDFSSEVKLDLVDRRVDLWLEDPQRFEKVTDIMELIEPWAEQGAEGGTTRLDFDPMNPRLAATDGSTGDKLEYFRSTLVKRLLIPLIRKDKHATADTEALCRVVLERFENIGDIDECFGESLLELFCVFRVVATLIAGDYVHGASSAEFDLLESGLCSRSSRSVLSVVATALDQAEAYQELRQNFDKFAAPTREHLPDIQHASAALDKSGDATTVHEMTDHLRLLLKVEGKARPSVFQPIADKIEKALCGMVERTSAKIDAGNDFKDDIVMWVSLLQSAQKVFGVAVVRTRLSGPWFRCQSVWLA